VAEFFFHFISHFLKKVVVWVPHHTHTTTFFKKCGVGVVWVWCGCGVGVVWCWCGVGVVWAKVVSCVPPYVQTLHDVVRQPDA